jgi:hypothetical protein
MTAWLHGNCGSRETKSVNQFPWKCSPEGEDEDEGKILLGTVTTSEACVVLCATAADRTPAGYPGSELRAEDLGMELPKEL